MLINVANCFFLTLAAAFYTTSFAKYGVTTTNEKSIDLELLDTPIASLPMNPLTRNALTKMHNILYLGELVKYTEKELVRKDHLGPRSVELLSHELKKRGLGYGMKIDYVRPEYRQL